MGTDKCLDLGIVDFGTVDGHKMVASPERVARKIDGESLLTGLAVLSAFAIVGVLVRGVRWDETLEFAQALTGDVPFPEGHPLLRYTRAALSLQTLISAGLVLAGSSDALHCGFRNFLFLLSTVLPVYLLARHLSGHGAWGMAAAVLAIQGIFLEFDGSYPMAAWPNLYSNGHIGGAWALLTLYAFVSERHRLAAFLVTMMPAVHIGQWPMPLGLAIVYVSWLWITGRREVLRRSLPFALAGLAITATVIGIHQILDVPPPESGAYAPSGDPEPIRKGFLSIHDSHRAFPQANGHVVLAGTLLLSCVAAWRMRTLRSAYVWLLVYVMGTAATVWGIMMIHAAMGADIPYLLIVWMPYRFINHMPMLCLALSMGILCTERRFHGPLIVSAVFVFSVFRFLLRPVIGDSLYTRFVDTGDVILFFLFGAALFTVLCMRKGDSMKGQGFAAGAAVAVAAVLAPFHQFGAAAIVAGILTCAAMRLPWVQIKEKTGRGPIIIYAVCVIGTALLCFEEWGAREWLPRSEFDQTVKAYLEDEGIPDAGVLGRPKEYEIQARLHHPVIVEAATPYHINYLPSVAPVIESIYNDLFGISFKIPEEASAPDPRWEQVWQARSPAHWGELGERYGFTYVLSPQELELQLERLFADEINAFYRIRP